MRQKGQSERHASRGSTIRSSEAIEKRSNALYWCTRISPSHSDALDVSTPDMPRVTTLVATIQIAVASDRKILTLLYWYVITVGPPLWMGYNRIRLGVSRV